VALTHLLTTLATRDEALALAHDAVDAAVAACVQIVGPISSVYRWDGAVHEEQEFLCVLKVPSDGLERLVEFVRSNHPYDVPELTELPGGFVDPAYLAWSEEVTAARPQESPPV
jgi:periplasmic divalent cation tolerance protein